MTTDGNAAGDRYECGCFEGRRFDYLHVDEIPLYKQRGGLIYELDGSLVEPWRVQPGYLLLEDMPLGPDQISGYETDNPRVVYMFEVCFDVADWLQGNLGLSWRRERNV
jgi:hypothetical protein